MSIKVSGCNMKVSGWVYFVFLWNVRLFSSLMCLSLGEDQEEHLSSLHKFYINKEIRSLWRPKYYLYSERLCTGECGFICRQGDSLVLKSTIKWASSDSGNTALTYVPWRSRTEFGVLSRRDLISRENVLSYTKSLLPCKRRQVRAFPTF